MARDVRETPRTGAEQIVAAMAASASAALERAGLAIAGIAAAGCSAPGPLDHLSGVVHEAPNLAGFLQFPLGRRLADELGLPVFVDRDTAMAAIGEALAGAAMGRRDFVYLTVSTGVGGAVVSGGRMLRGASGTAGELGHLPVDLDGPRCGCGANGCAEAFAAGRNLADQFGVPDARLVYAAAAAGDARARSLIARAEAALGSLAVGLVNALNPSLLIVGGAVAEHQPAHVLEPMRRAIAERAFRTPAAAVRVVPPLLGSDVSLIGAALAARDRAAGEAGWFM